ncbi:unnamed protein product [Cuscuta europaea]|uniref:Uncharacterized protein n=1 Tax=Cuscuta europaea TaxID=41803 RepID=A0A9P1EE18_CUSEU|nr:unnamed protein product [Cuscuta europaea]
MDLLEHCMWLYIIGGHSMSAICLREILRCRHLPGRFGAPYFRPPVRGAVNPEGRQRKEKSSILQTLQVLPHPPLPYILLEECRANLQQNCNHGWLNRLLKDSR